MTLGIVHQLPLRGASGIASRDKPEFSETIHVFLALGEVDRDIGRRCDELEQPIENRAGSLGAPNPPAFAVRAALAEILGRAPGHLEQQLAALVAVVIGGDDVERLTARLRFDLDAELGFEPFDRFAVDLAGLDTHQVPRTSAFAGLVIVPFPFFAPVISIATLPLVPKRN